MPIIKSRINSISSDGRLTCERVVLYEDGSEVTKESYDEGKTWTKTSAIFNHPAPTLQIKLKLDPGEAKKIKILPFIKTITKQTPKLNITWDTIVKYHETDDGNIECLGNQCLMCDKEHEKSNKKKTGTTDIDELF